RLDCSGPSAFWFESSAASNSSRRLNASRKSCAGPSEHFVFNITLRLKTPLPRSKLCLYFIFDLQLLDHQRPAWECPMSADEKPTVSEFLEHAREMRDLSPETAKVIFGAFIAIELSGDSSGSWFP